MKTHASLAAGVLAAIGATACCFGPLLLVTLGFSGAWAAGLRSLAPLQPVFAGLTALFVGWAFHRILGPCGRGCVRRVASKAVTEAGYPASFRK